MTVWKHNTDTLFLVLTVNTKKCKKNKKLHYAVSNTTRTVNAE